MGITKKHYVGLKETKTKYYNALFILYEVQKKVKLSNEVRHMHISCCLNEELLPRKKPRTFSRVMARVSTLDHFLECVQLWQQVLITYCLSLYLS